jgi:hypothetical protein
LGSVIEWYDSGFGPTVEDNVGCNGSTGLGTADNTAVWKAASFRWNDPTFERVHVGLDFQTDNSGHFDDDRVGWTISDVSTDSSNVFGLQLDPGAGGYNVEGYWDGVGEEDRRPSFANLPNLNPSTYYRFEIEFTKLAATSAKIDFRLYELDANCNPQAAIVSGSVADTSALGDDRPDEKYFTASTLWPAFKNHTPNSAHADNAYARITYTGTSDCYQCNETDDNCYVAAGEPCADDGLYCNGVEACDGAGLCVGGGNPCEAALVPFRRATGFESGYTLGSRLAAHQDWFGGEASPGVLDGIGCGGGVGLGTASGISVWEAVPLYWNHEGQVITVGAHIQSDSSGRFSNDRIGWSVSPLSTNPSHLFGVEMHNDLDGFLIRGYWDGISNRDKRPKIVDLAGLIQANTWYHLVAVFTRLAPAAARVETYLYDLTVDCVPPGTLVAAGSIPDTSALGPDAPNAKYFISDAIWPAFRNDDTTGGYHDDLYVQAALAAEECKRCDESDDDCIIAAGAICTDSAPLDCYASRCDASGTCNQTHSTRSEGTPCEDSTPGDCYAAGCVADGVCSQTDSPQDAGTPCSDLTPLDCMLATCDGGATCQQDLAFQPTTQICDDNLFCNGFDMCDSAGSCAAHTGDPCQSYVVNEDLESGFSSGSALGDHSEWQDRIANQGPTVQTGVGCNATIGLGPSVGGTIWMAHPFSWRDGNLASVILESDFQASNSGGFSADRVGWSVSNESLDSTQVFGVQLDSDADGHPAIEGFWDGAGGESVRISIVSLEGLVEPERWYRLRCEIAKLTASSAQIEVSLSTLDATCVSPVSTLATGSIADTSALGNDAPQERYFTAPVMWPEYLNANAVEGEMDNLRFAVQTTAGLTCNEGTRSCE